MLYFSGGGEKSVKSVKSRLFASGSRAATAASLDDPRIIEIVQRYRAELKPLGEEPDIHAWFFRSMIHAKLGQADAARRWYDQACAEVGEEAKALLKNP